MARGVRLASSRHTTNRWKTSRDRRIAWNKTSPIYSRYSNSDISERDDLDLVSGLGRSDPAAELERVRQSVGYELAFLVDLDVGDEAVLE